MGRDVITLLPAAAAAAAAGAARIWCVPTPTFCPRYHTQHPCR
jgi:hypothetical protein